MKPYNVFCNNYLLVNYYFMTISSKRIIPQLETKEVQKNRMSEPMVKDYCKIRDKMDSVKEEIRVLEGAIDSLSEFRMLHPEKGEEVKSWHDNLGEEIQENKRLYEVFKNKSIDLGRECMELTNINDDIYEDIYYLLFRIDALDLQIKSIPMLGVMNISDTDFQKDISHVIQEKVNGPYFVLSEQYNIAINKVLNTFDQIFKNS